MKAQICPVCRGTGHVDSGFYTQTSGQWTSAGGFEPCRSCWGYGYILIPGNCDFYTQVLPADVPTETTGD